MQGRWKRRQKRHRPEQGLPVRFLELVHPAGHRLVRALHNPDDPA